MCFSDFEHLVGIVKKELNRKMSDHLGIDVLVKRRSRFEGWLKVELCDSFEWESIDTKPEQDHYDIVCNNWAIQLKTIPTNYAYSGVRKANKNITNNIQEVICDIQGLQKQNKYAHKAIIFVAYPLNHDRQDWQEQHLDKIARQLECLEHEQIKFRTETPGVIYIGKI